MSISQRGKTMCRISKKLLSAVVRRARKLRVRVRARDLSGMSNRDLNECLKEDKKELRDRLRQREQQLAAQVDFYLG